MDNKLRNNLRRKCSNCQITTTPLWRKNKDKTYSCNACSLYFRAHNTPRPIKFREYSLIKDERKISNKNGDPYTRSKHTDSVFFNHLPNENYDYFLNILPKQTPQQIVNKVVTNVKYSKDKNNETLELKLENFDIQQNDISNVSKNNIFHKKSSYFKNKKILQVNSNEDLHELNSKLTKDEIEVVNTLVRLKDYMRLI